MRAMTSQSVVVGMIGMTMVVMTGCAQPPTGQLEAAQKALNAAKVAGAPAYATEDFTALEQQFALAQDEVAKQQRVISIFRSYTDADKMLSKVVEPGGRVAAKAAQNKEAAKMTAIAVEQEAQQVVASTKTLMMQVPSAIDRVAVDAIHQDIRRLEQGLDAVHQLIEMGDYPDAQLQANVLKKSGASVLGVVQNAIGKTRGRNPKPRG